MTDADKWRDEKLHTVLDYGSVFLPTANSIVVLIIKTFPSKGSVAWDPKNLTIYPTMQAKRMATQMTRQTTRTNDTVNNDTDENSEDVQAMYFHSSSLLLIRFANTGILILILMRCE